MTVHRHVARWAADDLLSFSAVRGRVDGNWIAAEHLKVLGLDKRIDHESRTGLALKPCAVAAVHRHRLRPHAVPNALTGAASVLCFRDVLRHVPSWVRQ